MSLIRQLIYGIECPYRNMSTRKQQMEAKKKILSSSKAMLYVQIWILKKMLRFFPETYNGTLWHSVSSKIRSLVHHKGSRKMTVTLLIPQLFFQLAILPFSLQCESVVISFLTTSFCRKPQGLQIYMLLFLKH